MNQQQISSLLDPAIFPEPTSTVLHLQTHISHIFLTDSHAYKIKKPVDFGFLNFTTLEQRHHFCNEELRLNRKLAATVYLEVVPLFADQSGGLCFNGSGEPLEYAVKMRRLPQERMMQSLLAAGEVYPADINDIAGTVATFHATTARGNGIELFGTLEAIRANWLENLRQTESFIGRTIEYQTHKLVSDWAIQQLTEHADQFLERIRSGFIRECHGDLHSGNICLEEQVQIFDCIEFNEKFRYSDTAADVAFLAMDLENHGRRDLAEQFILQYCQISGDTGLWQVLPLYLCNRAFIRGKVESFRLDDPLVTDEQKQKAAAQAARFFRLSGGYALRTMLPLTLFITCGPTGSGKSALARELGFELGVTSHTADCIRKQLAGIAPTQRGADIYTPAWNRATYQEMLRLVATDLDAGRSCIADATFRCKRDRSKFIELAAIVGAQVVILLPESSPDLIKMRLEMRQQKGSATSDGTWQIYQQQLRRFEAPDTDEGTIIRLDATKTTSEMLQQLYAKPGLFNKK